MSNQGATSTDARSALDALASLTARLEQHDHLCALIDTASRTTWADELGQRTIPHGLWARIVEAAK